MCKAVKVAPTHDRHQLLGWVARSHRLFAVDAARRTLDGLTQGSRSPIAPSMASMLERGSRRWNASLLRTYQDALGPAAENLVRAYSEFKTDPASGLLLPQDAADTLDRLTSPSDRLPEATQIIDVVKWVTTRRDPLGRSSWETLVSRVVDQACDRKGDIGQASDAALACLAIHPVAGRAFAEYALQLATEVGHPKSFVPLIAQQQAKAPVHLGRLVTELESPSNRWLLRENLNLAAAKLSDPQAQWTARLRRRTAHAAMSWLTEEASEHEIKRAAAHVLRILGLGSSPSVSRIRLADEVRGLSQGIDRPVMHTLVQRNAAAVISHLSAIRSVELNIEDPILIDLLASAIIGGNDQERRESTHWLYHSAYRPALAHQATVVIRSRTGIDRDRGALHSWVRLLGKLGSSTDDADTISAVLQTPGTSTATAETAAWALCDLASSALPRSLGPPPPIVARQQHKAIRPTLQRALVSTLGRGGDWDGLRALTHLSADAEAERRWWLTRRGSTPAP